MTRYRVTVTDRRGHRGAEAETGPSVTELVAELTACLEELGVDELAIAVDVLDDAPYYVDRAGREHRP